MGIHRESSVDPEFLYYQAVVAIREKRLDEAQALLTQVVHIDPKHEQAWLMLSSVVPDVAQTIECLNRVLVINPDNTQAREWLAFALEAAPQSVTATAKTEQAKPEERAVPYLGQYLLKRKLITEAQLAAALKVQQSEAQAGKHRRIGEILVEQRAISAERLSLIAREQELDFFEQFGR